MRPFLHRTSLVDRLELLANRVTDLDWAWWPFISLRPPARIPITTLGVARMAIFFGPILSLGLMFGISGLRHSFDVGIGLAGLCALNLTSFALYRITFAFFWNRRAARLVAFRLVSRGIDPARR